VSYCDEPNSYSHYISCGEFLDQLSDCELAKSYQFWNLYLPGWAVCVVLFAFVRSAKRVFTVRSFRGGSKFRGA
jgi:hypothetical protein